jgi:hypothetical protein
MAASEDWRTVPSSVTPWPQRRLRIPSSSSSSGSNHNGDTSSVEMRCTIATRAKQAIDDDQSRGARWEGGKEGDEGVSRTIRAAKHPRRWSSRDSLGQTKRRGRRGEGGRRTVKLELRQERS